MDKCALICEDNLTTAVCIKAMFEKLGYKADIAQSAGETFELLNKNKYNLLTLDILLPDKSGFELLKDIKNTNLINDLTIIVISITPKSTMPPAFKNDIAFWMEKSFDVKELEKALEIVSMKKEKPKVLHVENDEDLLKLVEISLGDIAKVTKANNLQVAKNIIEKEVFDIIILDYVFPEGTSDKLINKIKIGINKNAKIIIFSAYEVNNILGKLVDRVIIKTNISFTDFKTCIEKFI